MSKAVYTWDSNNHFNASKLVDDDYELKDNETFTKPEDGLYAATWNGSAWVGTPKETWEANQPKIDVQPSAQQKLNATLTTQMAQLMADNKKQQQINAQLTLQNAQLAQKLNSASTNKEA